MVINVIYSMEIGRDDGDRANWIMLKIFNVLFRYDVQYTDKYGYFFSPEYPLSLEPRYGYGKAANPYFKAMLDRARAAIDAFYQHSLGLEPIVSEILRYDGSDPTLPYWRNAFFSGLDALALMTMIKTCAPKRYIEVGSGNSTKFVRYAASIFDTHTHILSIDPKPRAEIDKLCNEIIRKGAEDVDPAVYDQLAPGDILFIDNSHRVLQNSDATVFFLEVLPRIKPGVIIHLHDIFLPYDYPPRWKRRLYSEQYALGAYLLGADDRIQVLAANAEIAEDATRSLPFQSMWARLRLQRWQQDRYKHGHPDGSFWFTKRK